MSRLDSQHETEDAVVRDALNSTWNVESGQRVPDTPDNPDREVCAVSHCGLDQGVLATIESWDTEDVFGENPAVHAAPRTGRASAMIASLRRVVEKGIADGSLLPIKTSHRYSLGVTFDGDYLKPSKVW